MKRRWSPIATVVVCVLGACAETPPPPAKAPAAAAAPAPAAVAAGALAAPVSEGPPVTLLPAATARPLLQVAISIASVDALLTKGATLVGRAVPLPIDPAGLRDMLLGQAGLPPEVAANLDLASPAGAAVVATGKPGGADLVMAVAARGPAEAERVIGALGKPIMKRGAVALIDNGAGGRGWVFRAGNVVVLSDDLDALTRGAMLALEARHATPEDLTAVIYPEAIAHANGTDVATALAAAVAALRASQAQGATMPAAEYYVEAMADMASLLGDVDTIEIGLSVDPTQGLALRMRLHPRPDTALSTVAHDVKPFALDRVVLAGPGTPTVLGALSFGPILQKVMVRQRERLAAQVNDAKKKKAATTALGAYDAMLAALDGQASGAFRVAREAPHLSSDGSYPLKDAASAGKLAAAFSRMDRAAALAWCQTYLGGTTTYEYTGKKESVGKLSAVRCTMTVHRGDAPESEAVTKLFGKTTDTYLAVSGTHLLSAVGGNAKARLATLATGKPRAPQPPLADALAKAAGREAFFYVDLAPVLAAASVYTQDARGASIGQGVALPIPVYGTFGGDGAGKVWTFDLTLPPSAFSAAGVVIQKMSASGSLPMK